MLPVFCLGMMAALTYARTRSLLAPMLAHATYNASIIAIQMLLY
jgi:membrane protease YdiL (CAAX protease family)